MPGNQVKDWDLYHKLIAEGHTKEEAARIANAQAMKKALSSGFASRTARKRKLIASLKRRRKYPPPVRGGTGKQRPRKSK